MSRPILVTSALPYASGPPHFGHLAGAYLPADVFVRYHRLIGSDIAFICGTDEHGVAITIGAEQEGVPYQEFADRWHAVWQRSFEELAISFDNFSQTSRRVPHYGLVQEIFLRVLRNGHIVRKEIQQLYSPRTKRFLADRYVIGTCYLCGCERARGDECPSCGSWLDSAKIIDPRAKLDPEDKLELRDSWQYELDLKPFAEHPAIQPWLADLRPRLKKNVATFVFDKMIEGEGLESRPITRDLPWGVPVPSRDLDGRDLEDVADKVLYVWFDAPIGYISATIEWSPAQWRKYWVRKRGEPGARLIHFIGKDNIAFHCIVFPAMLAWQDVDEAVEGSIGPGPGESYVLPENIPANEFFNLEGRKFNKSEGWVLDVDDFLDRYGADRTRFYLIAAMPETADSDFLWREFKAKTDLLANVFGNLCVRVLKFVGQHFDGRVPAPTDYDVRPLIERRMRELERQITGYHFRRALDAFLALAEDGNRFLDETKPWKLRKTDPDACGGALHAALQFLPALSVMAAPFVPGMAARLRTMLCMPARAPGPLWPAEELPEGHRLGEVEVLCPKIPDAQIAEEVEKLRRVAE